MLTAGLRCAPDTRPMKRMTRQHHQPRRRHRRRTVICRERVSHHAAASTRGVPEECPQELGEQAPPLLRWILEVLHRSDDLAVPQRLHARSRTPRMLRLGAHGRRHSHRTPSASPRTDEPIVAAGSQAIAARRRTELAMKVLLNSPFLGDTARRCPRRSSHGDLTGDVGGAVADDRGVHGVLWLPPIGRVPVRGGPRAVSATAPPPTGLRRYVSVLEGILPYQRAWLSKDIVAGITLAALAIPETMGYTKIAGMPVITGLYTILIPIAAFALLGSSRHLVVGADSATAAIMYAGIVALGIGGLQPASPQWVGLASLSALLAGGMLFLARIARLGFLANFLSRTVLVGFLTGVGVQVATGQVAGMLGIPKQSGSLELLQRQPHHVLQDARAHRRRVLADVPGLGRGARNPDRLRSLAEGDPRRTRRRGRDDRPQLDLRLRDTRHLDPRARCRAGCRTSVCRSTSAGTTRYCCSRRPSRCSS